MLFKHPNLKLSFEKKTIVYESILHFKQNTRGKCIGYMKAMKNHFIQYSNSDLSKMIIIYFYKQIIFRRF